MTVAAGAGQRQRWWAVWMLGMQLRLRRWLRLRVASSACSDPWRPELMGPGGVQAGDGVVTTGALLLLLVADSGSVLDDRYLLVVPRWCLRLFRASSARSNAAESRLLPWSRACNRNVRSWTKASIDALLVVMW